MFFPPTCISLFFLKVPTVCILFPPCFYSLFSFPARQISTNQVRFVPKLNQRNVNLVREDKTWGAHDRTSIYVPTWDDDGLVFLFSSLSLSPLYCICPSPTLLRLSVSDTIHPPMSRLHLCLSAVVCAEGYRGERGGLQMNQLAGGRINTVVVREEGERRLSSLQRERSAAAF